jgi:O-acetyl-ADP-ribose deacetylase (regulator of RNase III)
MIPDANYSIGDTTFTITYADITTVPAGALVSSDDNYLSMGGGVSAAIKRAAGEALVVDTRKHVPVNLGDVVVTCAGDLPAKYIFHGITIDLLSATYAEAATIRDITKRSLVLATTLGIEKIAFPALGTGAAGVPAEPCAETMTRAIAAYLSAGGGPLRQVTLALYGGGGRVRAESVEAFYAKSAELAVQWTGSQRLGALVSELVALLPTDSHNSALRGDLRRLLADIESAKVHLDSPAHDAGTVAELERSAGLAKVSQTAESVLAKSKEVVDWEDVTAQRKILNARLESLRTQQNVIYGNRNHLELQRSNYAPAEVPLFLVNALEGVEKEITRVDGEISRVKREIAALAAPSGEEARSS